MRRLVIALAVCLGAPPLPAASHPNAHGCATEPGGILTKLFRHRQQRQRLGAALSAEPGATLPDIGQIAIVDDSEGAVIRPNAFDLRLRTLRFDPSGADAAQYTAASQALSFDTAASDAGVALAGLGDDDTRPLRLPFSFPFYGRRYDTLHLNSDGNLTFTVPDFASSPRSLSRALAGPPRIFALFQDLDPSLPQAAVRSFAASGRFVLTWDNVPEWRASGVGPRQSFQIALYAGGRIEFHYRDITLSDAVVGLAPGELRNGSVAADFSAGVPTATSSALAEIFSSTTDIDEVTISHKFYRNHDDAYDLVIAFNNFDLQLGPGAFAGEINVRNRVLGIGDLLRSGPVFDSGAEFGSPLRLQSFVNMGPLSNYPPGPRDIIPQFAISRNTPIGVLGQEVGHRFLVYPRFLDPLTSRPSSALLGRQAAHWSFYFNSDASVVEGNRIEDRGADVSPRFLTTGTVERYNALDQYLMGLRAPGEVPATFLVRNPSPGLPASSPPQSGVSFDGMRQDITVQMIADAEGRRAPDSTVAQKHFNMAFVLMVREGTQPTAPQLAQLDQLRLEWENFFSAATDNRATARTGVVKALRISTWPAGGVLRGAPGQGTVTIASPAGSSLTVLLSADSGVITVPASVTIPAGGVSASFVITGNRAGVAELTARVSDPAFEVARSFVQAREDPAQLQFEIVSGDNQRGLAGAALPQPIVLRLRDQNDVPFSGVPVVLAASGNGVVTPARALTDPDGRVQVTWRLGSAPHTLRATLEAAASVSTVVNATVASPPQFAAGAVVSAATFQSGALAPGGLVSVFGLALAEETRAAASLPLPVFLGGTTVTIGGVPAPLLYVSPRQINLQVPFELAGASAPIVIATADGSSPSVAAAIGPAQPGIFYDAASGLGAIIHNSDGRPTTQRPARAGDFLQIYATGLGAVSPAVRSGLAAPLSPLSATVAEPRVTIGGVPAPVAFSGLAPGFAGLYQLTVQVPQGLAGGRQRVSVTLGGLRSNEAEVIVE